MKSRVPSCFRWRLLTLLVGCLVLASLPALRAQESGTLTTIRSLGPDDASFPTNLILGSDGNFYGTSSTGGANGLGTVSRVTPAGVLTVLYSFDGSAKGAPSSLTQASDGFFYGTTAGDNSSGDLGTVFQVSAAGEYKTLYTFQGSYSNGPDGAFPAGGLAQGNDGNLYGTTYSGGGGYGTFYSITPAGVLTIIYDFSGENAGNPNSSLVAGNDGNFYGTVRGFGSDAAQGGPFRITPTGEITFVGFFDVEGNRPIIRDKAGDVYLQGNGFFNDNFSELTPGGSAVSFSPPAYELTLVAGNDGNFYGTTSDTYFGSTPGLHNTVFQVTPTSTVTTLYNFSGSDGLYPSALFVQGSDGSFYGTTIQGGDNNLGTFYRLKASVQPAFFTGESALTNGVYYLDLPNGNLFGYYSFLDDPHYLYHIDLGYEYVFDAADGNSGVYLYDFASNGFFYTSPTFPFPYLYDFSLNAVLYYYPSADQPGRYTTNPRTFYNFATGQIITK